MLRAAPFLLLALVAAPVPAAAPTPAPRDPETVIRNLRAEIEAADRLHEQQRAAASDGADRAMLDRIHAKDQAARRAAIGRYESRLAGSRPTPTPAGWRIYNAVIPTVLMLVDAFNPIVWSVFGVIIGIAASKHRGFPTWWGVVGGVLLGCLAPALFLVSDPGTRKCAFCLSRMPKAATVCARCTREQP